MKNRLLAFFMTFIASVFIALPLAPAVSAYDSPFETTDVLTNGKQLSFDSYNDGDWASVKIVSSSKGKITISYTTGWQISVFTLMNSYGAEIKISAFETKSGSCGYGGVGSTSVSVYPNEAIKVGSGTITWAVDKGTYYLVVNHKGPNDSGPTLTMRCTISGSRNPSSDSYTSTRNDDSSGNKASTDGNTLLIYMDEGDKIYLGGIAGSSVLSSASWKSSDTSVAKVSSKGRVTAVGEGMCAIAWKSGSKSFIFYVYVEE